VDRTECVKGTVGVNMTFQEARAKLAEISGGKYRALYYELMDITLGNTKITVRIG